ncbi:maternal embryonic leucine zipper kinase-like [Oratosquilla oratoria]|uniref:maternal embryonic leucine zipper kinase-like n=1 Tax=Oratosquilla oratoria TaxID=337810 RepID=UPI003F76F70C
MALDRNWIKNWELFFFGTRMEQQRALTWIETEVLKRLLRNGRRHGEGTFAKVFLLQAGDRRAVAKVFKKRRFLPAMVKEAEALAALSGVPRVPTLYGVGRNPVTVITSCGGRSLYKLIQRQQLSKYEAVDIVYQVAESVRLIHHRGWTHNDLKEDNIVVKRNRDLWDATLIDFGSCVPIGKGVYSKNRTGHITFPHIAPELFKGRGTSSGSDVYSIGYLLASLIAQEDRNEDISSLIASTMTYKPEDRISVDDLVQRLRDVRFNILLDIVTEQFSALKI